MRSAAAVALASIAIYGAACAARAEPARLALSQFREALTLSMTIPPAAVVGAETPLRFRVQNEGPHTIEACVGVSRNVWILPEDDTQANEPIGISAPAVDRARCQRRFRLAPGAHFEWEETTNVPRVVRGPASLAVDVQIIDPRHCHPSRECPDTMLTASAPIEVR